jgi:signal transduction histidine kinase
LKTVTQLLDDLPVGVLVLEGKVGKPFYANKAAVALFGRGILVDVGAADLAQEAQTFIPGTDELYPSEQQPIVRALRGEREVRSEMLLRRDSKATLINVTATPILDDRGEVRFAVATMDDITAKRDLEERVRQLHKMESLGQLTAGMSHNFNNLLAIILNFIDFALDELPADSKVRGDLMNAHAAAQRGAELVANLMSYLRQRPLLLENIDVGEGVVRARVLLQSILGSGIELDVGAITKGARTNFDNGEMVNVLLNIAANARHAMDGQGDMSISVDLVDRDASVTPTGLEVGAGRYVRLSVRDTGKGIPPGTLDRIFDPFFTTKDLTKGTGLGLSSALVAVEAAGGTIEVESTVGVGTTFNIFLPAADHP